MFWIHVFLLTDDIIKRKLLIEGDGGNDDRRINSLLKTFIKWCQSSESTDERFWFSCFVVFIKLLLHYNSLVWVHINLTKRAFYAACNTIFLYGCGVDEIALLNLQETFSLCVIMCAIGVNVTSAGWQVTLCDPIWHLSSCSGEACCKLLYPLQLLTYLLYLHYASPLDTLVNWMPAGIML